MVYASFYPKEGDDYNFMRDALGKLKLNDAAFAFEPEANLALGTRIPLRISGASSYGNHPGKAEEGI